MQNGDTLGIAYIFQHLAAQRALAERSKTAAEGCVVGIVQRLIILHFETLEIAENIVVNQARQSVKFENGVLKRCGCKENLLAVGKGILDGVGNFAGRLVNIAQPVRFVDYRQIPRRLFEVWSLCPCKLVGAYHNLVAVEWIEIARLDIVIECFGFEDARRQEEFLLQLRNPLFAEVRRSDNQQVSAVFRPKLRNDDARLDGLAETYLVSQYCAFGQGRLKSKKGRIDLMRGQIDLRILQRCREFADVVRWQTSGKPMSIIFFLRLYHLSARIVFIFSERLTKLAIFFSYLFVVHDFPCALHFAKGKKNLFIVM